MGVLDRKERHLVQSHAHEELPGTVDLKARAGDDTAYGQALFPVPAADPDDPLQWPLWKKNIILIIYCLYSFLCNSTLIGSSVYISLYSKEFNVSPTVASQTSSYPTLAFGLGCIVLIPMYAKFGRRPTMLFSMLMYVLGVLGCTQATTFSAFMASRIIHAVGSGVCEALPVQAVNDIYFLHERGKRISYYTAALCLGSIGPLPAGYMLAAGHGFRLFFWVEFAFGMGLLVAAFFLAPETAYKRRTTIGCVVSPRVAEGNDREERSSTEWTDAKVAPKEIDVEALPIWPKRKTYLESLKPWSAVDADTEFFGMILRSFTYFLVPSALWVITSFGIYIGCAALAFNYTFPIKIVAPPYNWNPNNSGLIAIAFIIGYFLAVILSNSSDRLAAYLTRKNNGVREAEMRLGVMLPAMLIGPTGLVVYGFTAQRDLHWVWYFAGVAMVDWSALFSFTITLAYAIDSYNANMSEMLIAMNIGKNAISFGMGFDLLTWVLESGYAPVIGGAFGGIMLFNNLFLLLFMWRGKSIRIFFSKTWLARIHKGSVRTIETH